MKNIYSKHKFNHKYLSLLVGMFMLLACLCFQPTHVKAATTSFNMYVGNKAKVTSVGLSGKLDWVSNNKKIVTVKNNVITAVKAGKTTISAKKGSKTIKANVCVKNAKYVLKTTSLTMTLSSQGDVTGQITGKFYGKMDETLHYSSSDTTVVKVSSTGHVRAIKAGTAKIKVKSSDKKVAYCTVKVKNPYPIALTKTEVKMTVGDTMDIPFKKQYDFSKLTMTADNEEVASVSETGQISTYKKGSCIVTITTKYEKLTLTVKVYNAIDLGKAKFIAHRGYHVNYLENTMAAFQDTENRGFTGVETDVQVTKDGIYVLSHNRNLKTVYNVDADISKYTYHELRQKLTKFSKDQRIISLDEFLTYMETSDLVPCIELKRETLTADDVKYILALIRQHGLENKATVSSFSVDMLTEARRLSPDMKLQYIIKGSSVDIDTILKKNFGIDWDYDTASQNPDIVKELIDNQVNICFWVIDNPYDADDAFDLGASYVTTNAKYF